MTTQPTDEQNTMTDTTNNELRIAIAEKLGWKRMGFLNGAETPSGNWIGRTISFESCVRINAPHYDTDPAAALLLVEHMRKEGWQTSIYQHPDGSWECCFRKFDGDFPIQLRAPTFPLAVALAFCKAANIKTL